MKMGEQQTVILVLENGMRVKGIGIITEIANDDPTAFELTIPNMHLKVQKGKLVESIESTSGSFGFATSSYSVSKSLMQLVP